LAVLGKINPLTDRPGDSSLAPGPGSYNPNDSFVRMKSPEYKFSRNTRKSLDLSANPLGPGTYNKKPYLGEGPHYTIGLKREVSPGNKNPGPADYRPWDAMTYERAPEWKISNNLRASHQGPLITSNELGPGQYNYKTFLGEGPHYTMG
jgi:Sperm-tail PG-rich repeat